MTYNTSVKAIIHSSFDDSIKIEFKGMNDCVEWTKKTIGSHFSYLDMNQNPDETCHLICSTMIDTPFSSGAIDAQSFIKKTTPAHSTHRQFLLNAYECASWGYGLRYHLRTQAASSQLVISIIDVNVLDLKFWQESQYWGKSGFGVTTILLEIDSSDAILQTGFCIGNNIIEFASAIRKHSSIYPKHWISLPFFPDHMSTPLRRALKKSNLLPELHDVYGHIFGADPWVSLLHELIKDDTRHGSHFTICSLAFRGYFTLLNICLSENITLKLITSKSKPS